MNTLSLCVMNSCWSTLMLKGSFILLHAYNVCCIYLNALQTFFIKEANIPNPDQNAP